MLFAAGIRGINPLQPEQVLWGSSIDPGNRPVLPDSFPQVSLHRDSYTLIHSFCYENNISIASVFQADRTR